MTIDVARDLRRAARDAKLPDADEQRLSSPLTRLRLLIALDALLIEGGVSRAGARLGLGAPATSRLLAQLREIYGDPLLIRANRRMVPSPFAERLRPRVRALAAEAEALLRPEADAEGSPLDPAPPLGVRPEVALEGAPRPEEIARRLDFIGRDPAPERRLAKHIATIGAGAAVSRPLTMEEAEDAFRVILTQAAHPAQVGALLVAMQQRGLTAPELAGFAAATRAACGALPLDSACADLDWPAYLSPRRPTGPWFLHSARLVARAGLRILLHGQTGGFAEAAARRAGLPVCGSIEEARRTLASDGIAFLPLGAASPSLQRLLDLYTLIQMRSPANLVAPLLNPLGAPTSLLGAAGASYRTLHRDAAALLGWPRFLAVEASRDCAQATPFRWTRIIGLVDGRPQDLGLPPVEEPDVAPRTGMTSLEYWEAVWTGAAKDPRAETIILSTAAIALASRTLPRADWTSARELAGALWDDRGKS